MKKKLKTLRVILWLCKFIIFEPTDEEARKILWVLFKNRR
jgi:hypothetical protein